MDEPARYEIQVAECLDERWEKWFGGMDIQVSESGGTTFRGRVLDQPALFGVLGKIRDLGLTLISVERSDDGYFSPRHPDSTHSQNEGR